MRPGITPVSTELLAERRGRSSAGDTWRARGGPPAAARHLDALGRQVLAAATGVGSDVSAEHVGAEPSREGSGPSGVGREGFGKETEEPKEERERGVTGTEGRGAQGGERSCETGPERWRWLWHVGSDGSHALVCLNDVSSCLGSGRILGTV